MSGGHRQANLRHRDTVDLPLTLLGIALFSAKEAHRFLILDVLRTIHHLDDFPERADSVLAKPNTLNNFFEITLAGIPVAPDLKENFVVRHRTSFRPRT